MGCNKNGLIEIKLGGDKLINEGVENLKEMYNKIDIEKMNKPSIFNGINCNWKLCMYKRRWSIYYTNWLLKELVYKKYPQILTDNITIALHY